ncbi:zinc finger MYND domain-containing protein [Phanerochaete sordida]|uniref:Zinc finger MYND domain-containing protein n=1 Tax=Phanerochaete sordida TaxID=48140 RepID=A0A9P3LAA8_9APHY|nr:zinc finger MYND domain-containing protein [Phanerochaete sordida]
MSTADLQVFASITQQPPTTYTEQLVWEATWEQTIAQVFQPGTIPACIALASATVPLDSNSVAEIKAFQLRQVIAYQQSLIKECTPQFVAGVRLSWTVASARQRETCVLQGIAASLAGNPACGTMRLFCPESTRTSLLADSGTPFFALLDAIVRSGRALPLTDPILFEHAAVDTFLAQNTLTPAARRSLHINRADFLSRIVWKILQAILGRSAHDVELKPPRVQLSDALPNANPALAGLFRTAQRAFRTDKEYACVRCNKLQSELGEGREMQRCGRCAGAGRKVLYCSRECQRLDWAQGVPKPHKETCGRKLGA